MPHCTSIYNLEYLWQLRYPYIYIYIYKIESIDASCVLLFFFLSKSCVLIIRATTPMVAKICKIQKVLNFTHFNLKNTYISTCKNMQIYKITTVIVHICMIIVHV